MAASATIASGNSSALLLAGGQSPSIARLLTDRVDIPAAPHDMQVDNPSAVNDAALTFLARHSSSQSAA